MCVLFSCSRNHFVTFMYVTSVSLQLFYLSVQCALCAVGCRLAMPKLCISQFPPHKYKRYFCVLLLEKRKCYFVEIFASINIHTQKMQMHDSTNKCTQSTAQILLIRLLWNEMWLLWKIAERNALGVKCICVCVHNTHTHIHFE